jgi:hypothetical protein
VSKKLQFLNPAIVFRTKRNTIIKFDSIFVAIFSKQFCEKKYKF